MRLLPPPQMLRHLSRVARRGDSEPTAVPDEPTVVLITGATSGIGRASAHRFARRGDRLVLVARSAERLHQVRTECAQLGARGVAVQVADVTDTGEVDSAFRSAVLRWGRVDIVVHAAAVMAYSELADIPLEVFDRVLAVNVGGTQRVARAAVRQFRQQATGGRLVLLGSELGRIAAPTMGAYVTSKWAVRGFARVLQLENRKHRRIAVRVVSPAGVNTPIYRQAATFIGHHGRPPWPVDSPETVARVIERVALRRWEPRREISVGPTNLVTVLGSVVAAPVFDALVGPAIRLMAIDGEPADTSIGNVFRPQPAADSTHGRWPSVPDSVPVESAAAVSAKD